MKQQIVLKQPLRPAAQSWKVDKKIHQADIYFTCQNACKVGMT